MTEIGKYAFRGTALKTFTMPINVTHIQEGTFMNCTALEKVDIVSDSTIDIYAFTNTGLTSIDLNDVTVKQAAFTKCSKLKTINFNENVVLEYNSFLNCQNLVSINVPEVRANVLSTNYNWTSNAFNDCPNLIQINGKAIIHPFLQPPMFYNRSYDKFFKKYFNACQNVGFVTQYEDDYCDYIVETKITPDMTDLMKARILHDWIINKVTYDSDEKSARKNHVTSSVFMNDSTVCDGYARGYARLMNAAGMEAYYLNGTDFMDGVTHAWNLVNINGNYFHVDVCWDDGGNKPRYSYFLLTDSEVKQYGAHASWNVEVIINDRPVSYTGGSTDAVNLIGDLNGDGNIEWTDLDLIKKWLKGKVSLTNEQLGRADLNLDGNITAADEDIIQQYYESNMDQTFRQFLKSTIFPNLAPLPSWL